MIQACGYGQVFLQCMVKQQKWTKFLDPALSCDYSAYERGHLTELFVHPPQKNGQPSSPNRTLGHVTLHVRGKRGGCLTKPSAFQVQKIYIFADGFCHAAIFTYKTSQNLIIYSLICPAAVGAPWYDYGYV